MRFSSPAAFDVISGFLLLGLYGCTANEPTRHDGPVASPSASASTSTAAPACAEGAADCGSSGTRRTCNAAGVWENTPCKGTTHCIAGTCVTSSPSGGPLRMLPAAGYLNAWSTAGPLSHATAERISSQGGKPPEDLEWHPRCARDGYVVALDRSDRPPGPSYRLLAAELVTAHPTTVRLSAGAAGTLTVFVGGRSILDGTPTAGLAAARPFPNESTAAVRLDAGISPVRVLFRHPGSRDTARQLGFWLHAETVDGSELGWQESIANASCPDDALLDLDVVLEPTVGGFELAANASHVGVRRRAPTSPLRLWLDDAAAPLDCAPWKKGDDRCRGLLQPTTAGRHQARLGLDRENALAVDVALRGVPASSDSAGATDDLHGDAVRSLQQLEKALVSRPNLDAASRASAESLANRLSQALAKDERFPEYTRSLLDQAAAIGERIVAADPKPYGDLRGLVWRAYRSALDGHLQPYVAWIPPSYEPGKPMPLVVVAHGKDRLPEHALRTVVGQAPDESMSLDWAAKHLPPMPDLGVIIVAPRTYENAGPWSIGEDDVLAVVSDMERSYSIDPARVSITGYSLGGTVAFALPLHYPTRFSAAAPLCGYPNLLSYNSVRRVPHMPWEDALLQQNYLVNYAANGLHAPLHIVHGGLDGPGRSKVVADAYRKLGYTRIFDVQDDLDHNVWDYAYENGQMLGWLRARKRPLQPTSAILTTLNYRYNRAHWLRLIEAKDPTFAEPATIEGVVDDGTLALTTKNVQAFSVIRADLPREPKAVSSIVVDGQSMGSPPKGDEVWLRQNEDRWTYTEPRPRDRPVRKGPHAGGPLSDVLRTPLVIVRGTQDPEQRHAIELVAAHLSSWDMWAGAQFPVRDDVELSEAWLNEKSLVLVGGPKQNSVAARLMDALPVAVELGETFALRGERFDAEHASMSLIQPHPYRSDRYVVLHASRSARGLLGVRNLPRLQPDFLVFDERMAKARGGLLLDKRETLAAGFFDADWR